jgi:carboxypeptidase T
MSIKELACFSILALMLSSSLALPSVSADPNTIYLNDLVRIDVSQGVPTLPRGVEIVGHGTDYVDIILPRIQEAELDAAHISYTVTISDVDGYSRQFTGQYHSFAQMEQILQNTASAYPDITSLYSVGTTIQGRNLWCLEITDNPGVDEGEPNVLFMGLHHAREWPTIEITLSMINILTSQYATNSTVQNLVNNRRIYIIPCENPDGYYESHDNGDSMWRKNMHYFPQWGTTGVDTNRNYAGSCDGKGLGEWGTAYQGATSHGGNDEVFCGPDPNSELETQAIENFVITHDISCSISWHTYSELVLYPWGYTTTHAPDYTILSQVASNMANLISSESGGGHYTPEQSDSLYPTTGDYLDWAYGYGLYVLGRVNFCYTIEACQQFQPSTSHLDQICTENCQAGIYFLTEAENLSQVVPRVMPPTISDIPDSPTGSFTVSWQVPNPNSNPDAYELDQLTNLTLQTDGAENGMGLWNSDGFTVSSQRANTGTYSFKGHTADGQVSTLTTATPLFVTPGTSVDFWTYYNTEQQFDFGYFEVSLDGRYFNILGNWSGTGTTWTEHTYDMSSYAGKSVFLRFRYETDDYTHGEGFYVDDITSVPSFQTNTTISTTLTEPQYIFHNMFNGTYYYRVRGHNAERGWCDFSTIQDAVVTGNQPDTTPPVINITTPKDHYLYVKGVEKRAFFTTLVLGSLTVKVDATDDIGVASVQIYLDGSLMSTFTQGPYSWDWTNRSFGKHTLKVVSTDTSDNDASVELVVWKFF